MTARCEVCGQSVAPLALARSFDGYVCADVKKCRQRGDSDSARLRARVALQQAARTHARMWLRQQVGGGRLA
jgi:recombinational DNA repair protein (RecF pathway)